MTHPYDYHPQIKASLSLTEVKKYLGITQTEFDLCVRLNLNMEKMAQWEEWPDELIEAYDADAFAVKDGQLGHACLFVGRWLKDHRDEVLV